jgi:hypothetical protein
VEDAEDYFAIDPNATAFLALDDADTEAYLAWASRILDQKTRWRGSKTVETSGLRWPRTGVTDKDGNVVGRNVVPQPVKDATCELARFLMDYNPAQGQGSDNLKRIAVDVVEIEYQEGTGQYDWPSLISQILRPLGTFSGSGAMGFGKIYKV